MNKIQTGPFTTNLPIKKKSLYFVEQNSIMACAKIWSEKTNHIKNNDNI